MKKYQFEKQILNTYVDTELTKMLQLCALDTRTLISPNTDID